MFMAFAEVVTEVRRPVRVPAPHGASTPPLCGAAPDGVWRGADAAFVRSLPGGPARSALRLQARLARHWLAREA